MLSWPVSTLLSDWLLADGVSPRAFLKEAFERFDQGQQLSSKLSATWATKDDVNVIAKNGGRGVGLDAAWTTDEGKFWLEHVGDDARLLLPLRFPITLERAMPRRDIVEIAALPFLPSLACTVTAVYPSQSDRGLDIRFQAGWKTIEF